MLRQYLERRGRRSTKWSGYFEVYERYLAPYRDRPITFLEIGVLKGGSLEFWRDYFPLGRIVGIDRDPKYKFSDTRIEVHIGDQSDAEFLKSVPEPDIVLDDGGHVLWKQVATLEYFWPRSLYMVEDAEKPFLDYAKEWIGKAHVGFYNGIVAFEPWKDSHKIDSGG